MKKEDVKSVELFRGNSMVSGLLGSFGSSLKETRLTSVIGFLIASEPHFFCNRLGIKEEPLSVSLETYHTNDLEDSGRSDIQIETIKGTVVIEAKTGHTDPLVQARKYSAYKKILLTNHISTGSKRKEIHYVNWEKLANYLRELAKRKTNHIKFLCNDLIQYLETYSMIRRTESLEIYAREINEEHSLNFFLKARMYGCSFEKVNTPAEASYFAPHFAKAISRYHPGVNTGISYIAKIEHVEVVESWSDFIAKTKHLRGKAWINSHKIYLDEIHHAWNWKDKKLRSLLYLGEPRLVFNPPIKKENLQKGKGFLSKRTFSFDELFEAWTK